MKKRLFWGGIALVAIWSLTDRILGGLVKRMPVR